MKNFILFVCILLTGNVKAQNTKVLVCLGSGSYAYHSYSCQGLKQCRANIEEVTVSEAVAMGRKSCGYCYKKAASAKKMGGQISPTNATSSQCSATTKKGTRCSRASRSGGYCWQHGG